MICRGSKWMHREADDNTFSIPVTVWKDPVHCSLHCQTHYGKRTVVFNSVFTLAHTEHGNWRQSMGLSCTDGGTTWSGYWLPAPVCSLGSESLPYLTEAMTFLVTCWSNTPWVPFSQDICYLRGGKRDPRRLHKSPVTWFTSGFPSFILFYVFEKQS